MNVLAVSHLFPHTAEPRYGIFVARQLEAMAKAGADVTILVPRPFRPKWMLSILGRPKTLCHSFPLVEFPGVTGRSFPYPSLPGAWYNAYCGPAASFCARKIARELHGKKQFDIVYGSGLTLAGDIAWRLGRQLNIPSACLAIGSDVNIVPHISPTLYASYRRVVQNLDGVLTCGDSLSEKIEELREDKALCVYGVVDLEKFQPADNRRGEIRTQHGLAKDKQIILYVGYLRFGKGLRELLQAFSILSQERDDLQLVLCGDGPDGNALKVEAKATGHSDSIRFTGPVQPDTIAKYMQAADLFVLPSYHEGMPNAVMEAMACGLPVVCTNVGGLPAALEGCAGAILVPPKESVPLARAISDVLRIADSSDRMRTAARAKAEASFGALPNARKILGYLAEVVKKSRPLNEETETS